MLGVLLRLEILGFGEEGRAGAGANRAVARVVAGVGAKGSLPGARNGEGRLGGSRAAFRNVTGTSETA